MDIFGDDNSDDEKRIMKSTWSRMKKRHATNGYREGVIYGKDVKLQQNFDKGYIEGFEKSRKLGFEYGQQKIKLFLDNKNEPGESIEFKKSLEVMCNMCKKN